MRFPSQERFLQYCVSKRRTYLRLLFDRRNPRGFFELWKSEIDFAQSRFEVEGASLAARATLGLQQRWLLLQDLHQVARSVVPDFAPAPPSVIATLPGAMHQIRVARSMLIAGQSGVGKEQLAILLHVLSGRPGAMVRVAASELGHAGGAPTRQMMPERGSVFVSDLEQATPAAQEELLGFLNGEARRRDLLFFVATRSEPRELVSRHGLRRDLLVRVSQTEVRLPAANARPQDLPIYVGDVIFDLVRVPPERLSELRGEAQGLAERWSSQAGSPTTSAYDFFSEALSYVLWREKKEIATRVLSEPWCQEAIQPAAPGNFRGLCEHVAEAFDRRVTPEADARSESSLRLTLVGGEPRAQRCDAPAGATSSERPAAEVVPTGLSRDQLLRIYYQALLAEERGDLRRVATRAGRRLRSLHAELARLGVRIPRELTQSFSPDDV